MEKNNPEIDQILFINWELVKRKLTKPDCVSVEETRKYLTKKIGELLCSGAYKESDFVHINAQIPTKSKEVYHQLSLFSDGTTIAPNNKSLRRD
jgi:hypothetical protein